MATFNVGPLQGQQRRTLSTRSSAPAGVRAAGRLPGSQRLNLAISLPLRNPEQLQTLLNDLYDPASPNYRHFLTVEQFTEQFGPTTDDYERVSAFARSNGLTVTHTTPNRMVLDVTGAVADVERTFQLKMQVYQHPTEARTFYAPDVEPSLDASLPVEGVSGLSTFALPHPASLHQMSASEKVLAQPEAGTGPNGSLLGSDIRGAYAPGVTLDGTGQTIGLFELAPYNLSDIQLYFTTVNQPLNVPIFNVLVAGVSGVCGTSCDDSEEALDIEASISMAPNLSQLLVYEGTYPVDVLNQMATDNVARQLSCSWEFPYSSIYPTIFQEFAAQGQSFFGASGDEGALAPPGPTNHVDNYPADDPNVTGVGGTGLNTSGPGGMWQSEVAWPLSTGGITNAGFAIPSYQIPLINSSNQGSTTLRNTPDVAAVAQGNYFCWSGQCNGVGGGTSLSTPVWAGFLALANQQANGASIGFLNPTIYQIAQGAGYANDFHDITTGNNFNSGSPNLYSTVAGYDLVTGLGSPNGQSLINALAPAQTGPNFTLVSTPGSLSVVQGSQGTSTITIHAVNGFTGTVNLSATVIGQPAGVTVSFNPASISGAQSSTLTVSTTSSTFGPSILIAVTGTSGGLTQTDFINATVLLPDLVETAVSAPPASVNSGASFSVTDTVENSGQAPAGASVTQYYLSPTATKTSSSILLAGSRAVPALAAGATSSGTANVTVPVILWPNAPNYLLACANNTGTVTEAAGGNCIASTSTIAINQPQLSTTTTLAVTSAGNPVTSVSSGSVVTLAAAVVSGGAPVTTGQVNFCDASAKYCTDIHLLGTAQLTSKGTATLSFVPSIGSHTYNAVFVGRVSGAGIETASTSGTATLNVSGKYPTTTAISESGSVGDYTLSATVTSLEGSVSPTGSVSFLDLSNGSAALGTAALNAGVSKLNWFNSQTSQAGSNPESIAVGDFNGDGIPDLAMADYGNDPVTILLGTGNGTFTAAAASPTGGLGPRAIATGDFNGDGIPDLAVVNEISDTVTILLGNGNGTFTAVSSPATGSAPTAIAIGDFNNDGIPDLAVGNQNSKTVTILLGNGDGTFTAVAGNIAIGDTPLSIALGEFNGDGKLDLVVGSFNSLIVFLGIGDGTFAAQASILSVINPYAIAVGDFNGDGKADLGAVSASSNNVSIFLGKGDGTFTAAAKNPATGVTPISIAVGDFNGSGKADLAVVNEGGNTVTILLGNGDGTFVAAADSPATGGNPFAIARGNFNGDGEVDLAVVNGSGSTVTILTRQLIQTGTATLTGASPVGTGTHQVDASYPGDSNYSSSVSGTTGLTAVTKTVPTVTVTPGSSSITTTQALTVTVAVSGTPAPTGSVTLTSGSYTSAATTLTSGSAQINIPAGSLAAGSDTLTGTYTPDSSSSSIYATATGTSSTVTVTKATPTVTVTPSASSITTAQALSVTVAVSGTPTATGSVTLTSGSYTSAATPLSSGSAQITVSAGSLAAGSDTLTGTYSGDGNYSANTGSASVTVTVPTPSFTIAGTAVSIARGATTGNTSTITVAPTNGFTGSVALTAAVTSSPSGAQYPPTFSFGSTSPVSITGTSAGTATLTISTTAASSAAMEYPNRRGVPWYAAASATLACILLWGIPARRRSWRTMLGLVVLLVALAGGVLACGGGGGGSGGGGGGGNSIPGTTAGTYTVTVTGTVGATNVTGAVTLNVQ